jgi:selenocysteine-specific elongation factor
MNTVVVGTAGHIDHGKSTLVRALTGIDPDRLKEEQERGITIDLGFAHFTCDSTQVAFVDVPGHERFVRNMLAGAGGIDAVVLVIDAAESIRPQTREHFDICRLIGVNRGVIALTKIDAAGPDAVARSREAAAALAAGSFLEGAPILEVSAHTGEGLETLRQELVKLAAPTARQQRQGVVRLPVDRAFAIKGFGAVATGTLVSGQIAEGDSLSILPDGRTVRVRGVQVHGQKVERASSPQRVAVNLADIETRDLRRGQTLATDGALTVTTRADVRVTLLPGACPLKHGDRVRIHVGSAELNARVSIAAIRAAVTNEWNTVLPGDKSVQLAGGANGYARLKFESSAALTRGERMVVRAGSPLVTVGGAMVLDPEPPVTGVRRGSSLERFLRLDSANVPIDLLLQERGELGLSVRDLVRRWGLDLPGAQALVEELLGSGRAVRVGDRIVGVELIQQWEADVLEMLAAFHRTHPLQAGMTPGAISDRPARRASAAFVEVVLGRLAARGLTRGSDRIRLAAHAPAASPKEQEVQGKVERAIRDGDLAPPDATDLATILKAAADEVEQAIQWLLREKRLIRTGGLLFHAESLGALKGAVKSERAQKPAESRVTLDIATFKARFKLTRKHAIPLLEWLDRERVTRRMGDVRIVL